MADPKPNTGFCCPKCELDRTDVLATRQTEDGQIRRRRRCPTCGHNFYTVEVVEDAPTQTERNQAALIKKILPRLFGIADDIDLIRAEHD